MTIRTTKRKLHTFANTDGLINWLPQPGLLRNQPPKSMLLNSYSTYKILWHLDCSCCRDKVNRVAGRRSGALFFARHLDYFILTQNSHPSPGLGTVKTIYRDQTTPIHLPGLAKNAAPRHRRQLIKPPAVIKNTQLH